MNAKILLIEDDESLRRGLEDNLKAQGWTVAVESDGEAGYERCLTWQADLILLDIMLPKVNGYEICRSLRLEGIEVPIIMLTAKGQTEDVVRGLELGANDYVVKPFALAVLFARIRRLLKGLEKSESYDLGNRLVLDLVGQRVKGIDEELSPKELGVLTCLVTNEGRALTRSQILQEVWGEGIFVTERSVDRAVKVIRSRLGEAGTRLETVRGVGYRWREECAKTGSASL